MRNVLLLGALLVATVAPGYSQFVNFGVKAGVPLTDAVHGISDGTSQVLTDTDRWLVGPTAEVRLPFHLSFEVDALYRRQNYTVNTLGFPQSNSANDWQFPFLAKYEFRREVVRPFVDAGVTYRHVSNGVDPNTAGFTVGGGVALKVLFLKLAPEIRYTRFGGVTDNGSSPVVRAQNQADLLVGFTF